jgi:hypothetical protein
LLSYIIFIKCDSLTLKIYIIIRKKNLLGKDSERLKKAIENFRVKNPKKKNRKSLNIFSNGRLGTTGNL